MIKLFGNTIDETRAVFSEKVHLGGNARYTKKDKMKVISRVIISVMLLIVAIVCLIMPDKKEYAGTIIGAITGYWLK